MKFKTPGVVLTCFQLQCKTITVDDSPPYCLPLLLLQAVYTVSATEG